MSESASTEETFSAETLEKMAAKIRAMLAKAESTEFPEEAATYHQRAEELRRKYQLAEETLIAEDATSIMPVIREIVITNSLSPFYQEHFRLWSRISHHFGVLFRGRYDRGEITVTAVGYASDIRLVEGLYQTAWMTMVAQLEPSVDPSLSDGENVYRLRHSGMERNRIANLLWGADMGKAGHAAHARVGKLYREACAARGESASAAGKGVNKAVYREKYAEEFVYRIGERLARARDAVDSQGGALVLKGREDRVNEAFWAKFPEEHPDARKARAEAARAAAEAEGTDNLPAKTYRWTKADQKRYDQRHNSEAARRGSAAGAAAADRVEISRTSTPAKRVEPGSPKTSSGIALGN